ncbi:sulfite reductase [ferredoxin] [bacterium BMS3Bbin10]|nr:sulfite reductase [ferredoxin] [bacterium BMS3Bbin10]
MYRYDEFDATFVRQRVKQFRGQVERRAAGELSEDEFRPLRLMNGLYLQLHAYMLRVAVPYGTLSARQMRKLAFIADSYDRGYGHFTTRQNIQYNWPRLPDVPDILGHLAEVEMHAIQTSGNCIRNVTADHWAGVAADEVEDPRPYAELMRQWSSLHPEFSFLPRKFKIAVTGSQADRAAIRYHDIGLRLKKNTQGEAGFEVFVGGGMGRTPMLAARVRDWLARDDLLTYLEAIMRVFNLHGRRDNKYKARIKILVHALGAEEFSAQVEEEFARTGAPRIMPGEGELKRIAAYFAPPGYDALRDDDPALALRLEKHKDFAGWVERNVSAHGVPGYAIVNISLKPIGGIPGDASADQMRAVADLAESFSLDEIRISHEQNLVLPNVRKRDLFAVWLSLGEHGLADANIGLASDIIACPGLDYCGLATARSIPVAQDISKRLGEPARQREIGDMKIKISGCINACGHHHAGHIGILGLEKRGREYYQITLGGSGDESASVGEIIGPGFSSENLSGAVETIVDTYVELRQNGETFLEAYRRVGPEPFKEAVYATH